MRTHTGSTRDGERRGLGTTGKLVVGGTVSTGLLLGGYAVTWLTLAERLSGAALLPTSLGLFLLGAVAGLLVSVAAGLVGREAGWTLVDASRDAGRGMLYAVPASLLGALVASWMGMVVIGRFLDNALPMVGSAIAALVGAGVLLATLRVTVEAGANAVRRLRHAT